MVPRRPRLRKLSLLYAAPFRAANLGTTQDLINNIQAVKKQT